jgi:hypothetical protein
MKHLLRRQHRKSDAVHAKRAGWFAPAQTPQAIAKDRSQGGHFKAPPSPPLWEGAAAGGELTVTFLLFVHVSKDGSLENYFILSRVCAVAFVSAMMPILLAVCEDQDARYRDKLD